MIKSPWVWIHEKLTTGIHGVGAGTVGIMDKDKTIQDADGDTGFEVEQSADEDKIHGKVAGVEAFLLSPAGELTLDKQSSVYVTASATPQVIPTNKEVRINFNTEVTDVQNEFNSTTKAGAADATEANKLHDADGGFAASDVGAWIWNKTDNTYAIVTGFVDSGELDIDTDIMADGENYILYHATFTAAEDGEYLISAKITWAALNDGNAAYVALKRNATYLASSWMVPGATAAISGVGFGIVMLVANDSVYAVCRQDSGGDENIMADTNCQLYIQKLA